MPTHRFTAAVRRTHTSTRTATALLLIAAASAALAQPDAANPPAEKPIEKPSEQLPGHTAKTIDTITAQFRRHGLADAPAKPAGAVRLATYNIHELFDNADDPALTGRQEDIGRVMIDTRQAATAHALRKIDADIVALQEVESLDALTWYRDQNLADLGYTHAAAEDVGHSLGLEQAVLSRYPILATQTWTDRVIGTHPEEYRGRPNRYAGQPLTFRRSPLMAEIGLVEDSESINADQLSKQLPEADRLTLLIVHFKTGDGSEAWRAAEGAAIAEIIAELKADRPDRRVIVLGDFATPESEGHTAPITAAGLRDAFKDAPDHGPNADPKANATSITGDRACRILLGPGTSLAEGSTPFVLGTVAPPERLDRRMGFRMPGFASDHYPVVCDLNPEHANPEPANPGSGPTHGLNPATESD